MGGSNGNHCSFVLLAEFHIFEGAQLKYQFPQPLGVDERYEQAAYQRLVYSYLLAFSLCRCFRTVLKPSLTIGRFSS